jgi:hypothetical protein
MDQAVWIFRDDEFRSPLYAEPTKEDLEDDGLWTAVCEHVEQAYEDEGPRFDTATHGDWRVGWKHLAKVGLTFVVCVRGEVEAGMLKQYLTDLSKHYLDEVDEPRFPELDGVEDVVVDILPPWDD